MFLSECTAFIGPSSVSNTDFKGLALDKYSGN